MRHLRHPYPLVLVLVLVALASCGLGNANTSPPTSAGWPLTLGTDHAHYGPSDVLKVSVTNHLSTAVSALDMLASCTILSLAGILR